MISNSEKLIDIKENTLLKMDKRLLEILLKDKTTGKNIIWATDNYARYGAGYAFGKPISIDLVTLKNGGIIKPRVEKSKTEQQKRVRQKAEVFTPSWICNAQNNLVDEAWFDKKSTFNTEDEINKTWQTTKNKIVFPDEKGKTWQDYIFAKRMEMTCGEAPYITSRYDTVTGEYIEVENRIGLLDRKLRVVNENTNTKEDWINWAKIAVQNIYGFDWQGDNILLARENVLYTIMEHYKCKFDEGLTTQELIEFAKIIAWNIWQMDGLKFVVPNSCCTQTKTEQTLFESIVISTECEGCKKGSNKKHNGIYCKIKDWRTGKTVRFVDIAGENK
ncbi:MAG: restriction endonuclease subunit M [Spirochaetales bacterium]|nr:restriction endonuclease subunit M [Spirochaetales bacterium]